MSYPFNVLCYGAVIPHPFYRHVMFPSYSHVQWNARCLVVIVIIYIYFSLILLSPSTDSRTRGIIFSPSRLCGGTQAEIILGSRRRGEHGFVDYWRLRDFVPALAHPRSHRRDSGSRGKNVAEVFHFRQWIPSRAAWTRYQWRRDEKSFQSFRF